MNTTIDAMTHVLPHRFAPGRGPESPDDQQEQADVHRSDRQLPGLEERVDDDGVALGTQAEGHERRRPWLIANSTRPMR